MKEPPLPERVKHIQGLYTRKNSDLFIDDLTATELRQIANHREWYENRFQRSKDNFIDSFDFGGFY